MDLGIQWYSDIPTQSAAFFDGHEHLLRWSIRSSERQIRRQEVVHWCRTKMLIDADWPWFFVSIYATGFSPSRSGLHHVTSIFAILLSNTPWARSVHCCSVHRSFTAAPTQRHHRLTASSFWWKRVEVCGGELHMQMWPIISHHNNKPYE